MELFGADLVHGELQLVQILSISMGLMLAFALGMRIGTRRASTRAHIRRRIGI